MADPDGLPASFQDPVPDPGVTEEHPLALAARIVPRFDLKPPWEVFDFPQRGNIHRHAFLIQSGTGEDRREFLLQRINQQVFTRPGNLMSAMLTILEAQRESLARRSLGSREDWEVITLVPTREGEPFLESEDRTGVSCWRLMVLIPDCSTVKSLSEIADPRERLLVAKETGRGLALYGDLVSGVDTTRLVSPLPGYRDTEVYFDQLHSVLQGNRTLDAAEARLPEDPDVRAGTQQQFLVHLPPAEFQRRSRDPELRRYIDLALAEEEFGKKLLREARSGRIRTVAIHGDPKVENFLFDRDTGRVRSLVDLDTIMPHSWLADWGDMIRSLSNVAGERERDLKRVQVDMEIFEAVSRGFLSTARQITPEEVALMPEAARIIALELGVRFLADYLRGDSYFQLDPADPPDLNKVRAMVQLTLFERLRDGEDRMHRIIERIAETEGAHVPPANSIRGARGRFRPR